MSEATPMTEATGRYLADAITANTKALQFDTIAKLFTKEKAAKQLTISRTRFDEVLAELEKFGTKPVFVKIKGVQYLTGEELLRLVEALNRHAIKTSRQESFKGVLEA